MKLLPRPRIEYVKISPDRMVRADWLAAIDVHIDGHLHLSVPKLFDSLVEAKAIPRGATMAEWYVVLRLRLRMKRQKQLRERIGSMTEEMRQVLHSPDPNSLRRFFRQGAEVQS